MNNNIRTIIDSILTDAKFNALLAITTLVKALAILERVEQTNTPTVPQTANTTCLSALRRAAGGS
jgi:hypothetical protein